MTFLGLHHVRFAVGDPEKFASFLMRRFGFYHYGHRVSDGESNGATVLCHNNVYFIIDRRKTTGACLNANELLGYSFCNNNVSYPVDTVCDTCFQCNNIEEILTRVKMSGKGSCLAQSKLSDDDGTAYFAILQSPFGNVQHTLVDLSKYNGQFLPHFNVHEAGPSQQNYLNMIDHLAYMVPAGQADEAVNWYNFVFQFERLLINRDDQIEEGFKVESGLMGMKLKAIHGINLCASNDHPTDTIDIHNRRHVPVKFVFGEPLTSSKSDQISTFLEHHGGSGIQHIALGTDNILEAANHFKDSGASFVAPPSNYYQMIENSRHVTEFGVSLEELVKSGILIESNQTEGHEISLPAREEPWYILQVFTRNLFRERTFFLELIQRHRTEGGFGAGNIKALWDGVQADLSEIDVDVETSVYR